MQATLFIKSCNAGHIVFIKSCNAGHIELKKCIMGKLFVLKKKIPNTQSHPGTNNGQKHVLPNLKKKTNFPVPPIIRIRFEHIE